MQNGTGAAGSLRVVWCSWMKKMTTEKKARPCEDCGRFTEDCGGWERLSDFLKTRLRLGCWHPKGCLKVEDESSAQKVGE